MTTVQERQEFVAGLREMAAFLENNPDLPMPISGGHNAFVETRAELAAIARTMAWDKNANGDYFYLSRRFTGGHSYEINVHRSEVCRKVVTGTKVILAVPEHEVEEFHWVCDEPLLAEVTI